MSTIALLLAGSLSPVVTEFVKRFFKNPEDNAALAVFVGVSFVISLLVLTAQGQFNDLALNNPQQIAQVIINTLLAVVGLGTVIFNLFKSQITSINNSAPIIPPPNSQTAAK